MNNPKPGRPPLHGITKGVLFVRITPDLITSLKQEAEQSGNSVSEMLQAILSERYSHKQLDNSQ